MPDDDATRSRRYRRHKAGDHSMCQHDRHGPVLPALRAIPAPEPEGELDSRAELVLLARQLAAAYSADPSNWALARELRTTLLALPEPPGPADPLDVLREMAARVS